MQTKTAAAPALQYAAFQDKKNPSDWRVECLDIRAGDVYVAIFSGSLAKERAIEYAEFKNRN